MIDTIKFIIKLLDNNRSVNDFEELEIAIDPLLKSKFGNRDNLLWKLMYFCVFEDIEEKQTRALARADFNTTNKGLDEIKDWLITTGLYKALKDWYLRVMTEFENVI